MRRFDAGVGKHGRQHGLGRDLVIVLASVSVVAVFLWWIGGMQFWR